MHVRVEQKLTVLLTLATGAGHWGLGAKRRQARVKHKAVLGDAMLPAELGDAVPCRDKLDQTGRFQIHLRRGQRTAWVLKDFQLQFPLKIITGSPILLCLCIHDSGFTEAV